MQNIHQNVHLGEGRNWAMHFDYHTLCSVDHICKKPQKCPHTQKWDTEKTQPYNPGILQSWNTIQISNRSWGFV